MVVLGDAGAEFPSRTQVSEVICRKFINSDSLPELPITLFPITNKRPGAPLTSHGLMITITPAQSRHILAEDFTTPTRKEVVTKSRPQIIQHANELLEPVLAVETWAVNLDCWPITAWDHGADCPMRTCDVRSGLPSTELDIHNGPQSLTSPGAQPQLAPSMYPADCCELLQLILDMPRFNYTAARPQVQYRLSSSPMCLLHLIIQQLAAEKSLIHARTRLRAEQLHLHALGTRLIRQSKLSACSLE